MFRGYVLGMNRKPTASSLLCAAAGLLTPLGAQDTTYNVLFITVDDMRPELPAYGHDHVVAPNFDRLTNKSLTFNRAYVQQAICQPARANVLTGARPDTTRIYNVFEGGWPTFRNTMGAVATLPSTFKDNGYWTASFGKNFHHVDNPSFDHHQSFYQTEDLYQLPENRAVAGNVNERPPWEFFEDTLEANTMDAKVAAAAVQAIRDRAADGTPFFIAAGFWKPHLPFSAPQKHWDLYDRESIPIAEGLDSLPVQGALPVNFYDPFSGELTTYRGGRPPFVAQTAETQAALANGTFTTNQQTGDDWGIITVNGTHIYPEDYARALTHGYLACISFIDAQIGLLLDALEEEDLLDSTIIVLWGDHGMHVGQHGSWPKHTNMEIATRYPLIIHHPDMPAEARGVLTNALTESVDIMPTVLELAGLPMPATHDMEGVSLVPLLENPHQSWKTAAFSQYPKEVPSNSGVWYMGYAMRTDAYTYMQWREMDATDGNPISLAQRNFTISNRVAYEELYDMVNDPTQRVNIGGDPQYRALMDALAVKTDTALVTGFANTQHVAAETPAPPVAHAVSFIGGSDVDDTLTAFYIYADPNGDSEDGTLIEWVRAEEFAGPYDTVIATGESYTLQTSDLNHYVRVRVTPESAAAPTTGDPVLSAAAVVAGVGFTDGSDLPPPQSAVYEGFDYPAGVINSTSAGGRGWNGGWWGNDGLSFGGNSGSAAADFSWTALPQGYYHEPVGRAATNGANANNPYRQLAAGQTIDLGVNATRYFSFLYHHNGSAPVFEKRFHAGTDEVLKLQINAAGSLSLISTDQTNMNLLTLDANAAYVVLGRIQSVASGNDTLSVSIYKAGDTVPDTPPAFAASVQVNSSAVIDRIFMGNPINSDNTGNSHWDELHIDATWGSVIGAAAGDDENGDDNGDDDDDDDDPLPPPGEPELMLHLTFDGEDLADSSPANLNVTGNADYATENGRTFATLNGVDQAITAPILGSFPDGLSIAFWTRAHDGENGMPKNTALGWARQGGTTGDLGDGLVLGFGWNNSANALVRVGRENNTNDDISIPELTDWLNTWVHWAVVKDPTAGTIRVYRDGQLYSSVTGRHIVPAFESQGWATGAGFRIGRYFDVYYKGDLDDYRLYHGVLSSETVQTIYQQGAATGLIAFNVTISGTPSVGELLTGSYDFIHPGGAEGDSTFQWYRSATEFGVYTAIDGATTLTYIPVAEDDGGFLIFGVTPVGDDTLVGQEALSDPVLIGTFTDRSLQNTLYRLIEDQALNVVFFGGSITDGAGQNNGLPWRTRTENWFTAQFPEVNFTFTNASISGTSSEFGVFRTDRHVLSAEPDLVFVEFAVNDLEQPSGARTRQTMEGIVRKIRQSRPTADIVFVYTTTRANAINFYEQGQLPSRTVVHQEVADHYGIHTIDVAEALVAHKQMTGYPYRIEHGEPGAWDPAANHYLPDHVHPSNLGHQVYGDTVAAALDTLLSITPPANPVPHPMPELLSGNDMTSARIIDHTHPDVTHGDGWAVQAMGIGAGGRTEDFLTTTAASTASPITVSFSGSELGVYYRRSTSGGQITWDVDDGAAGDTFSFWHETLATFTSFAMLSTELGEGNHTATVSPGSFEEHETLNIAGWLVMGEFLPTSSSFNEWADSVYAHLEGGAAHPEAAPDFVPPGGRLTNLQIFAYGGTPGNPPQAPALQSSETHPVLVYTRRIDGAAQPTVFYTTDLTSTWSTEGLQILSITPIDEVREEVQIQSPEPLDEAPVQFMAVKVEQ